jgi:hypothetical protein
VQAIKFVLLECLTAVLRLLCCLMLAQDVEMSSILTAAARRRQWTTARTARVLQLLGLKQTAGGPARAVVPPVGHTSLAVRPNIAQSQSGVALAALLQHHQDILPARCNQSSFCATCCLTWLLQGAPPPVPHLAARCCLNQMTGPPPTQQCGTGSMPQWMVVTLPHRAALAVALLLSPVLLLGPAP